MVYRGRPKIKLGRGWPWEDPPKYVAPPTTPEEAELDIEIEKAALRQARSKELWESFKVGAWLIGGALCFFIFLFLGALSYDFQEAKKEDCIRDGGRVEKIHGDGEWNLWVCVGRSPEPHR